MTTSTNVKIMSRRQVYEALGISDVTLWRLVKNRQFPKPIKISPRRIGWTQETVQAWLAERTEVA